MPGGTAISTVRTLGAIAGRGHWEVIGIAARHRRPAAPIAAPTVPVAHARLGRRALYASWHRLRRPSTASIAGPVDVVHATGGAVPPPGDAPLVVTIHDLAFLHRPHHFTPRGVAFMTRGFELARDEAAAVIVPSEATARDCRAHGVDADRLTVIGWGVDPVAVADADRDRVRRTHDLPDGFVLWVGTAEPRKNLPALLRATAAAALPLVLVGPHGWGVDLPALLEANPHARHLGPVPAADLAVLYDLATIFAYPSLEEGFGMPVLEAMAQGTAVVTSGGTATAEVVGDAGRTVDPTDPAALTAALTGLADDPQGRAALAVAGRARAATMTWDHTAAATEAVYERVRR